MPAPLPEAKMAELTDLIFAGRKVAAIKLYRELTELGLKESKEAVEALETSLRQTTPEKFTAAAGRGCLGSAAVFALLIGAGAIAAVAGAGWSV